MLLDLLSQSNYGRFNLKIAQAIGLETAIYLEELLDINNKAVRKEKTREEVVDNDYRYVYFTVDREYIKSRTTLIPSKQKKIDEKLMKIGILHKVDIDDVEMAIDVFVLADLVEGDSTSLKKIAGGSSSKSTNPQRTKKEAIADNLKAALTVTNQELRLAYYKWIDAIVEKSFLSNAAVSVFMDAIDNFSNRDLDIALELLEIATVNGWKDPHWAIKSYTQRHFTNSDSNTVKF